MGAGANIQEIYLVADAELLQEDRGHVETVMLARMYDVDGDVPSVELVDEGGHLDDLGAGAHDDTRTTGMGLLLGWHEIGIKGARL